MHILVSVALIAACSSKSEPATPPPAPPSPAPVAEEAPGPAAPRGSTLAPERRRALAGAIREGRRAAEEQAWPTALEAFERAVAIDPTSDDVRCEAAFVAFRADRLDDAERLARGLQPIMLGDKVLDRRRVPTAMCLYNLGLLKRARSRTEHARKLFARSLELRDNATVRAALEGLDAPTVAERATLAPAASWDEVRDYAVERFCAQEHPAEPCGTEQSELAIPARLEEPAGTGAAEIDARVVRVVEELGMEIAFLAVRSRDAIVVSPIGQVYNPGAFGVSGEIETRRFELVDLVPGGSPEVLLRYQVWTADTDLAGCEWSSSTEGALVLCSSEGSLRCAEVPLARSSGSGRRSSCDATDDDGDGDLDESAGATDDEVEIDDPMEGWSGEAVIAPPNVSVTVEQGSPSDTALASPVPIADVIANDAYRWPGSDD
jgi:hypothetical protein